MTKTPKDLECFELMSPEEQEQYLAMLGDIADMVVQQDQSVRAVPQAVLP